MTKSKPKEDNTVIMSDKYLSESGVQGGKVIADHIALGSFIFGLPLLVIGVIALIGMAFGFGVPAHTAGIIGGLLVTVIGLLLVIGGYTINKDKKAKK